MVQSEALMQEGKIFLGRSVAPEYLELRLANRHGLVTGATGTGKTVSLQVLAEGFSDAGVPVFAYGNFITVLLNFIILAFVIFLMVKQFNRLKRQAPPPAPAAPPEEVVLLRDIRDSLRRA